MGRDEARTENWPGFDTAMNRLLRDGGQTIAYLRRDGKTLESSGWAALIRTGRQRKPSRIEKLLGEFLPD
jgi:hypothetical protein